MTTTTIDGYACVNCHEAPCRCLSQVVDRRNEPAGPLARYRFPDGTELRLRGSAGLEALAAGARLVE